MEFGGLSFDSLVPLIFSNKGLKLNIVRICIADCHSSKDFACGALFVIKSGLSWIK